MEGEANNNAQGAAGATGATGAAGAEEKEVFDPSTKLDTRITSKYESQLKKEYQNDDFTGIEDINALYSGYRALEKANKEALHIPTEKSTPDEIKGFFRKIGMPEDKTAYELSDYDLDPDEISSLKEQFRDVAYKSGLTKGQARSIWMSEAASISAIKKVLQGKQDQAKETYDARYDDILTSEYPDPTRRAARKTEETNLYQAFIASTELGEFFEKTGLSLNPEFRHKLSLWYQRIDPAAILGKGTGSGKKGRLEDIYTTMA